LEEKKKRAALGINIIEINLATRSNDAWVFDTGAMIHRCKSLQALKRVRPVARNEVDLHVRNGAKVVALAVGVYPLSLPSGLVLELNNCYHVPALNKNIISSSCLEDEGYEFRIKDKCCSIFLNDMYYGRCPVVNGLYVLDLESSEINNVSAKRICMNNSNTTFSWHCRLGHTGKKRIEKLHKDGLLDSFDQESFKMCESCLIGKMMKAPFVGQSERASELLGLIHTDVCGPMNSTTRGGFQYFITFTDDMSRYGYIYLMRNKVESFEKFKEFQNEVQNNTGKTIKFLRSDRGGEYLSHEFSDHLKSCGIVPQLTPPGTP
jgi:hypothetical protein